MADAAWEMVENKDKANGRAVLDEDFLKESGYSDFAKYNCTPDGKPADLEKAFRAGLGRGIG